MGADVAKAGRIPNRLYKYRSFDNRTVDMLVADMIFFADPSTFNDPLDTKPSLKIDLELNQLSQCLSELVRLRVKAEMTAAATKIKYRGPKTKNHIDALSKRRASQLIAEIEYSASDPDYESEEAGKILFSQYIESELLRRYDKGIVSLAERAVCPLLWSHYGDQHKGICAGYSVPANAAGNVHKMSYGGSRTVPASKVAAMLAGDSDAQRELDSSILARKAEAWRYEREWRLVGPRGIQYSPLELEEVVFGMRCSDPVKYVVVSALNSRHRGIKFFEIRVKPGRFLLEKYALDCDELLATFPRRSLDSQEMFSALSRS